MLTLPGLIDIQTHISAAKSEQQEDWSSLTAAALAGGFTTVLVMPDAVPAITDESSLKNTLDVASDTAYCDFGQIIAATTVNARETEVFQDQAAAILLNSPGPEAESVLKNMHAMNRIFSNWPKEKPVCIDADAHPIGTALFTAKVHQCPVHVFNVSTTEQIELIKEAKELGGNVTCSVSPHHLFLSQKHLEKMPENMRLSFLTLGTEADRRMIWKNLSLIDCFASNHVPWPCGTIEKPDSPATGNPGLETALALYLYAVQGGFITMEDLVARCYTNPKRIFNLPEQLNTQVEVDDETPFKVDPDQFATRCKRSPYAEMEFHARIVRVTLRGKIVYENGKLLAKPGSGRNASGYLPKLIE